MFPTPPELREEMHEAEQHFSAPSNHTTDTVHQAPAKGEECLCGCAQRPDNSKKVLKIKILASLFLVISISLVGLNAYQRDAAQASNKSLPHESESVFQNPAGAIQAAESTFPTMMPLNETYPYQNQHQQSYMPVQMSPGMATPMSVPVQNHQIAYPQYNQYAAPANYGYQIPNCMNEVRQDLVGQRLKRFVSR